MMRRGLARSEEAPQPAADPLDLFASGDPPAFATDTWHRITFWNRGAERVLGRTAEEVLGKVCFNIVGGRDIYGNRFCYEKCPVLATIRKGEAASAFDMVVQREPGEKKTLSITTLQIRGNRPELFTLVHILRPVDDAGRVARMLADMGVGNVTLSGGGCLHQGELPRAEAGPPLTGREKQILRCVASGLQNKEIAQRLDISLATVRNHIHNILEKLEVHSKLEAVSLAFRNGWVDGGCVAEEMVSA